MAYGRLQHTQVAPEGEKWEGKGRKVKAPSPLDDLPLGRAATAALFCAKLQQFHPKAGSCPSHLHFLMRVTCSSDLKPAVKIT